MQKWQQDWRWNGIPVLVKQSSFLVGNMYASALTAAAKIQPKEFQNQWPIPIRSLAFSPVNRRPLPVYGSMVIWALSMFLFNNWSCKNSFWNHRNPIPISDYKIKADTFVQNTKQPRFWQASMSPKSTSKALIGLMSKILEFHWLNPILCLSLFTRKGINAFHYNTLILSHSTLGF